MKAHWFQDAIISARPDPNYQHTTAAMKLFRPAVMHQKRLEWKAHGMSEAFCCRLDESCSNALEVSHVPRPVTARDDEALEVIADGNLLLKGLMCNHGNATLLPRELGQISSSRCRPPVASKSQWKSPADPCAIRNGRHGDCQPGNAGRCAVAMHGWGEVQGQITMVPAYQPSDTLLSHM